MVMKCVDIPEWLKGLPLAPEFRPTDTEFADPIAYISKIEKEASAFGICKVIPPLPKPSKKYVVHNLNNSLSKCPDLSSEVDSDAPSCKGNGEFRAVFTTRHQELGKSEKKKMKGGAVGGQPVGAQKQVWQSGEVYTLEQFEAKSKNFARSQLSMVKEVSPLAVEAMFWKAASEEPIYVEYANDVPGSAFGEPEGHVRYIHRRRRRQHKRTMVDKNSLGSCGNKNEVAISSSRVDNGPCGRVEAPSASLLTPSSNKSTNLSPFTSKGCSNAGEMEGSAGWKLANSPWNLQVIARSPGSLTRFMPDDIPGVTSPMVYIGMLFSWFAWHVEDHELHSLNFLHTGSPKTWYSVPGEYAFSFEEVTRRHAYGENIDRLAALTLLGEKTTLLSPEVVVASGIPCCRLVQNPGEFVVTFPRAYHVGFSHGFNCGEAANFGTPQWLAVAKEAAVRRAAMNYLPMLSHQQLLYLLTMSFVSSVPRTLLPGVRSSRLRDRQKEERELLVKKAFLEDIEKENNLVTVLLHKSFSGNAVLWDVDMLPPSGKESELHKHVSADASRRNDQSDNNDRQDLLDQMNLYMENYSDFYVDDDVSSEFQIDSGTLPCIACGILGFPFMALVQPSKKAAKHLFPEDFENKQDSGTLKHVESDSHSDPRGMIADCSRVDRIDRNGRNFLNHDEVSLSSQPCEPAVHLHECQASHHLSHTDNNALTSEELEKEWDVSRGFLRPRVLCLEHAIQTEELLNTKGGANVLVICHSDFQKMRAHATIVAEEIGTSFKYNDISLANASQGHLSLIDRAIEDEQEKCAEDWTLKLNINLRHCVKLQRNCPLKKLKHAVILAGLFSNSTPCTASSSLKWQSRKVRSRKKSNNSTESTPLAHAQTKKVIDLGSTVDRKNIRTGNITIQYSRKKYKFKACSSAEVNRVSADPLSVTSKEVSVADSKTLGASLLSDQTAGSSSSAEGFVVASDGKPGLQHGHEMFALNRDQGNLLASQEVDLLAATSSMVEFDEAKAEICTSEKFALEDKTCDTNSNSCHTKHKSTAQETSGETEIAQVDISCTTISVVRSTANDDNLKDNRDMTECGIRNESAHPTEADFERRHRGEDDIMTRSPMPVNSSGSCTDGPSRSYSEQIEVSEQFGSGSEASDSGTFHNSEEQEIQNDIADKDIAVRDHVKLVKEAPVSAGSPKVMRETLNPKHSQSSDENLSERPKDESNNDTSSAIVSRPAAKSGGKRRRELDLLTDDGCSFGGFVKSPCEGLRPRIKKDVPVSRVDTKKPFEEKPRGKKEKRSLHSSITQKGKEEQGKGTHRCDLEGCRMSFQTKVDLRLHKRNRCPIEGCGKKFTSHKYALVHQRVHETDRPLKCPWKGCTMTFKWAWARTEHLRVHTGERPYKCKIESCGLTFRFVSDYSRHRRKTGHYVEAAN